MAKSIQERVRAAIAKREKDEQRAAYKAGESERRARAARISAEIRRERRDSDIMHGRAEPRNGREDDLQFRALFDDEL